MKKIIYSILNWNRNIEPTLYSLPKSNDIIICSNSNVNYDNIYHISAESNVAASKNKIIQKAKELNGDYLFIIEDDIKILNTEIFNLYISKLEEHNLGVIFYGYGNKLNTALNKPNPLFKIKVGENREEWFNRYPVSSLVCINLHNNISFDETLLLLEFDVYMYEAFKNKNIPFNGFYFEVPNSYDYIEKLNYPTERIKTQELIQKDKNILKQKNIELKLDGNADPIVNYLKQKNNLK